jgi:hypothetical protein
MNRLLDPIRFFPLIERGVRALQSAPRTRTDRESARR